MNEQECVNGHKRPMNEFICKECGTANWKTTTEPQYPEHEKLQKIQKESQTIGEFIEWLHSDKQIHFAKWVDVTYEDEDIFGRKKMPYTKNELHIQPLNIIDVLSEFFGIDQNKLELEKRQMLNQIRKLQH